MANNVETGNYFLRPRTIVGVKTNASAVIAAGTAAVGLVLGLIGFAKKDESDAAKNAGIVGLMLLILGGAVTGISHYNLEEPAEAKKPEEPKSETPAAAEPENPPAEDNLSGKKATLDDTVLVNFRDLSDPSSEMQKSTPFKVKEYFDGNIEGMIPGEKREFTLQGGEKVEIELLEILEPPVVQCTDLKEGTIGEAAEKGQRVRVSWEEIKDGAVFKKGKQNFTIGSNETKFIQFEESVIGMKVGGEREVQIPNSSGNGSQTFKIRLDLIDDELPPNGKIGIKEISPANDLTCEPADDGDKVKVNYKYLNDTSSTMETEEFIIDGKNNDFDKGLIGMRPGQKREIIFPDGQKYEAELVEIISRKESDSEFDDVSLIQSDDGAWTKQINENVRDLNLSPDSDENLTKIYSAASTLASEGIIPNTSREKVIDELCKNIEKPYVINGIVGGLIHRIEHRNFPRYSNIAATNELIDRLLGGVISNEAEFEGGGNVCEKLRKLREKNNTEYTASSTSESDAVDTSAQDRLREAREELKQALQTLDEKIKASGRQTLPFITGLLTDPNGWVSGIAINKIGAENISSIIDLMNCSGYESAAGLIAQALQDKKPLNKEEATLVVQMFGQLLTEGSQSS